MNAVQPTPEPAPPAPPGVSPAWPRSAQLALAFLLGVAVTLLIVLIVQSVRWPAQPAVLQPAAAKPGSAPPRSTPAGDRSYETAATPVPARGKPLPAEKSVDINTAPEAQLMTLPGVGPALARRICDERERALFRSVDDLDRVPGVGPKTVAKLRPYVFVGAVAASRTPD